MMKLSTHIAFLFMAILLLSTIKFCRTTSLRNLPVAETSADDDSSDVEEERRTYDMSKLRHFLLTANAEQRAAKREQQEFFKRELIREYLQSISDPNPNRFEEVRKRFKTYCNSYEDLMNSNWATCG